MRQIFVYINRPTARKHDIVEFSRFHREIINYANVAIYNQNTAYNSQPRACMEKVICML